MQPETELYSVSSRDELKRAIEDRMNLLLVDSGEIQPVLSYLISTGGKRLRPLLLYWTASACSATTKQPLDEEAALDIAAAFELVHLASLVHDDVIDGAEMRRSRPAAHVIFGVHSAILAGDYLFTRANKIALRYAELGIASLMNQAIELICEGEIAQDFRLFDASVGERDYISHICRKTASLVGAVCQAGAAMGRGGREIEEAMLRYGIELGCAFQITDDIIDITSPSETSGKPACNDLRRGVLTLPLILAGKTSAGETLRRAFAEGYIGDDDIATITKACVDEGCIDRARKSARTLARTAESRLSVLAPSAGRRELQNAARSIADRLY